MLGGIDTVNDQEIEELEWIVQLLNLAISLLVRTLLLKHTMPICEKSKIYIYCNSLVTSMK